MRIPSSSHRYISVAVQVERSHGEGYGEWYRLVIDTTDGVCAVASPIGGLLPRQRASACTYGMRPNRVVFAAARARRAMSSEARAAA